MIPPILEWQTPCVIGNPTVYRQALFLAAIQIFGGHPTAAVDLPRHPNPPASIPDDARALGVRPAHGPSLQEGERDVNVRDRGVRSAFAETAVSSHLAVHRAHLLTYPAGQGAGLRPQPVQHPHPRHFISIALSTSEGPGWIATVCGTSEEMIFRHYRS
jgi:hypothetical protein